MPYHGPGIHWGRSEDSVAVGLDLEERVRETIAVTFALDEDELPEFVNQATVPQWSSLNHMMLLAALEEQFGVRLAMQDMAKMTSLEAIVTTLRRHGVAA
jgi:acyl carrier protein